MKRMEGKVGWEEGSGGKERKKNEDKTETNF
jgi:hypothetical protein